MPIPIEELNDRLSEGDKIIQNNNFENSWI